MLSKIHKNIIRTYLHAKDDNKPHLMKAAFTDSAILEMKVNTESISFPTKSVGVESITDVLVRNFSQTYENVYTFCITESFKSADKSTLNEVSCDWLVCMTERESGNVRVGVGKYDWNFEGDSETLLANHLLITIDHMIILAPDDSIQIMAWAHSLPYPFCDSASSIDLMPDSELLTVVRDYLHK